MGTFENWFDERAKHFWAALEEVEEQRPDDSAFLAAVAEIERDRTAAIRFIREHGARHAFAVDCAAELREKEGADLGAAALLCLDLFDKLLDEREAWELVALADIIKFVDLDPTPDYLARLVSMKRLVRRKAGNDEHIDAV